MQDINISSMLLNKEYRGKILENVNMNKTIENYYNRLSKEYVTKPKMYKNINNKIERLNDCNSIWESDYYENLGYKDFKKTYYCKDKFCYNCKKWRQAQRMKKFVGELSKYDDDLYFVTYTVPNVGALSVKDTIKKILCTHRVLVRYFTGNLKTRHFDFSKFDFIGGLRVLEISINRTRKEKYHVHIHCAYILKDYKPSKPYIVNCFSVDHSGNRDYVRKFTEQEIMLQKIWFYLYNDINLKTEIIDKNNYEKEVILKSGKTKMRRFENKGYSVTIDKFKPGQYQEMFKYMVKDKVKTIDEDGQEVLDVLSYDEFKTLYFSTANVRQLESYGVLKNINDDDDIIDENDVVEMYEAFKNYLNEFDTSVRIVERIDEVAMSDSIYISKNKIYGYLRKVVLDEVKENSDIVEVDNKISVKEYKYYNSLIEEMIKDDNIKNKFASIVNKAKERITYI